MRSQLLSRARHGRGSTLCRLVLTTALLASFSTFAVSAAADDLPPAEDPACASGDPLLTVDAGCPGDTDPLDAAAAAAVARAVEAAPAQAEALPASCRLHVEAAFWTASDWVPLAQALAADPSPCADYYISIPPQANDKTLLRGLQDDIIRALGPRIHPVAEMTLGSNVGWLKKWIETGHSWYSAGVEFRARMAAAGYRFDLGETWLLNEFDRSTRRNVAPYSRAAMEDLLRGLYYGNGSGPAVPGIVEIGINFTHQDIPDVGGYKSEMEAWLEDSDFWSTVDPFISVLTKEVYPDMRYWGVAGSSRNQRMRHLTQYMEHVMNLVDAGPADIAPARSLFERAYMPLGNATWAARGPILPGFEPYCCGHGWTLMPVEAMLSFVSEQVSAIRQYAGSHPQGPPQGRLGFSFQPTNNLPGVTQAEFNAAKLAIEARIASAIHYAYRQGAASPEGACSPPGSGEDWCLGADVPGAAFTDAWETFEAWR